ncbi:hypothetical protein Vau01_011640 [Virgisporangium aurantiacum]|uniref:TIR domain-containing protein n=2 Tax=Virgisporangium aurantiacum TaxID=175570 RepID=A0A8J3Z239_9ACTN|nr:hypothetical protein Vau01_011640 [Virgisporangium aurantiacum]
MAAVWGKNEDATRRLRDSRRIAYPRTNILSCVTYLPPVAHSLDAIQRFYKLQGAADEAIDAIAERSLDREKTWLDHLQTHKRIDIVDRFVLEEYLASPDYYQMPLTEAELAQQLERLRRLLLEDNYTLCLSPEAINICFEVRGDEVRIRSDRRNRGVPRAGRISTVTIREPDTASIFEREFWSLFRQTEREFKDKGAVIAWIENRVRIFAANRNARFEQRYDVALLFPEDDRDQARGFALELQRQGLRVWLDEWSVAPGRYWQLSLEGSAPEIGCVAICIGNAGQASAGSVADVEAALSQLVRHDAISLTVVMPGASAPQIGSDLLPTRRIVDLSGEDPAAAASTLKVVVHEMSRSRED